MAIPMQVLRIDGALARCRRRDGSEVTVDTLLTGPLQPGQWVLSSLGVARQVVDAEEAGRIGSAMEALETLLAGGRVDLDACFADLVNREPQLPEHLRMAGKNDESK